MRKVNKYIRFTDGGEVSDCQRFTIKQEFDKHYVKFHPNDEIRTINLMDHAAESRESAEKWCQEKWDSYLAKFQTAISTLGIKDYPEWLNDNKEETR